MKVRQQVFSQGTLDSKLVKKKRREIVDLPDQEIINSSKNIISEGLKVH